MVQNKFLFFSACLIQKSFLNICSLSIEMYSAVLKNTHIFLYYSLNGQTQPVRRNSKTSQHVTRPGVKNLTV